MVYIIQIQGIQFNIIICELVCRMLNYNYIIIFTRHKSIGAKAQFFKFDLVDRKVFYYFCQVHTEYFSNFSYNKLTAHTHCFKSLTHLPGTAFNAVVICSHNYWAMACMKTASE